jgi:hypothetical protein
VTNNLAGPSINITIIRAASGKLYAGEAVLTIEHMKKNGKIEQTAHYHVYRRISAFRE